MQSELYAAVEKFAQIFTERKLRVCTAESCTGGGLAYYLTALSGSSKWFDRGWVTYSRESKQNLLGVPSELIQIFGAVSEEVVKAMASGALERADASYSIAITGIAGPSGGSSEKPVGTVWMAWATPTKITTQCLSLKGDRDAIRQQTILHALQEACHLAQQ